MSTLEELWVRHNNHHGQITSCAADNDKQIAGGSVPSPETAITPESLRLLADAMDRARRDALPSSDRQYVTLDQAAALVRRSKRTLEKYWYDPVKRKRHQPPDPAMEGGGGRAHEWAWEEMRPWLERVFRRKLPDSLPDSFRRT